MVNHKTDCQRVFSRYDLSCPRCQELNGGSAARPGWGDIRKAQEAQTLAAIRRAAGSAWSAAGSAAYQRYAKQLLQMLREAK